jgi:hypothetical protein
MLHKFWLGLGVAAIALTPAIAQAQSTPSIRLAEIVSLMGANHRTALNTPTQISGRVAQIVGNQFGLSDTTGQVVVLAGSDTNVELGLKVGDQITVKGQLVEPGRFQADAITKADGTAIGIPTGSDRTDQPRPQLQPQLQPKVQPK